MKDISLKAYRPLRCISALVAEYQAVFPSPLLAWITAATWSFLAAQFIISSNLIYSLWFYLAVAVPCVLLLWRDRVLLRGVLRHPVARLALLLFAYTMMHGLVVTDSVGDTVKTLRHTTCTALFVMAIALAMRIPELWFTRGMKSLIYLAIMMAIAAVTWYILAEGMAGRLKPFAQTDHAILGANVFAVMALASSYVYHRHSPLGQRLFLPILACGVIFVLIALTQSRGPMLSFALAGTMLLLLTRYPWPVMVAFVLALLAVGAVGLDWWSYSVHGMAHLPLSDVYDTLNHLQDRPSHRSGIWKMTWDYIEQRPWFGYGMQQKFSYGWGGVNPHNLFLAAFFYTGVFGGILLLTVTGSALRLAWQHRQTPQGLLCMVLLGHGVLACLTDQGQYVNSPAPLWTIFWFPIGMTIALLPVKKAE
jgi:O-antigen ligase